MNKVKELRQLTGAGFADCKAALEASQDSIEEAITYLKIRGNSIADKKMQRNTNQGIIYSYIHHDRKSGVMIELNCETDFVAMNLDFKKLAHNLCLHIIANSPEFIDRKSVPLLVESREMEVNRLRTINEGKTGDVVERIVKGRMLKFFQTNCLMEQTYLFDETMTVEEFLKSEIAKFGENIKIKRFSHFILGDESSKIKENDFFN